MKKWTFELTLGNVALILLGMGINLLGGWAANRLFLPIWMDSIGTFLSAVLLGPFAGALSGGLANVIADFFAPGEAWFAPVSIAGGLAVGWFFPRERKIEPFSVIATALFAGFVMSLVSLPLNLFFNGGYVGHPWGDALVDMLAPHIAPVSIRCLAGSLLVNMPDKALSIIIALSILMLVRKRRESREKRKNDQLVHTALAVLLSSAVLAGLCPASAATDFNAEYAAVVYGRENGLISSEINTIEQTGDGYIWVGAYSGLYRYNGSEFEQIFPDDRISNAMCLFGGRHGELWIGTNDSGVACFHLETGKVDFFTTSDGLPSDSIRSICGDNDGNIYVGTAAELCRIDETGRVEAYTRYPELGSVQSLCSLGNGRIVGVTARGLLFLLQDDELVFTLANDDPESAYSAAAYDDGGRLLAGTTSNVLVSLRVNRDGSITPLESVETQGLNDVNRIRYVQSFQGYFVAASVGLAFVDRNMNVQLLTQDNFSGGVSDVITDYQDNVWFASGKQGVMKLTCNPFMNVTRKALLDQTAVNTLLVDGDRIYIGTDTGLDVVDAESFERLNDKAAELMAGERVRHLMRDRRGNLWVSTYGRNGLVCISPDGEEKCYDSGEGTLGSRFRFSMELSDGTILAASTEGLTFIRNGVVTGTVGEREGMALPKILAAVECPDGSILAGSDGDGVYRVKNGRVIGYIGTEQGLQSLVVLRIVPCGKEYLYVTSNGLYAQGTDTANDQVRKLKAFPYNNNYDVYVAPDGKAWVSSSAGLYVVDAERMMRDVEYPYILLNYKRGLDTTLTANAWNAVSGNELYLCCTDGVRRMDMTAYDKLNENYRITLSSFTEEGKKVEMIDGAYQLLAGRGRLQIQPAVLNYAISDPLVYTWLEGTDTPGSRMNQSELHPEVYTTLPYGDYIFHVQILDELSGTVKKEEAFPLHKDAELYELTYYRIYLMLVCVMLIAFLAWTIAKMGNMAIIHRQYQQIKEAKEEAEYANQAKSRFLANMSHEIRTPINAVLGMDEMILRESSEPEIRGYASDIYTAGNTLLSLINDILDSSKIESGKMEIVPVEYELPTLIRDLYNMISQRAQAKDLRLELEVAPELPRGLYGDDVRVRQVITNTLTNAVKYTPAGTVWFRVGGKRDGEELVLHVEVEDTGIGIKEEDLPKLFEAFQRIEEGRNRHIEGTGLGMSITIQLLNMMHSRLEVESVYGKGSKFFFDLRQRVTDDTPVGAFSALAHTPDDIYHHEGAFIAPDARVLVVDDNAMNRKVFRSLLKETQLQITEADCGAEALRLAGEERFDMVFMDHMMPEMDGVEAMHRMRQIEGYDKTPIFVLTANAVTGAKEQYLADGFDGFVSKPVVSEKLEQAIRDALPAELLKPNAAPEDTAAQKAANSLPEELPAVDGLDWNYAWMHLPERELLESTVKEFRDVLGIQADKLERMYEQVRAEPENTDFLSAYRIQVHGMKSAAATIGIVPLAGMAKMLEFAARDGEVGTMEKLHSVFLAEWRSYGEKLHGVFSSEEDAPPETEREEADADMLRAMFAMLRDALENMDVDAADETAAQLRSYRCPPAAEEKLPALLAAVADLDEDEANRIMSEIENEL